MRLEDMQQWGLERIKNESEEQKNMRLEDVWQLQSQR